jgi:hypothetical protein
MARRGLYGTFACLIAMTFGVAQAGAAPAPCGAPQITDAEGDGHHMATDVLSAWFSEASGRLQGVIKVDSGTWVADHPPGTAEWALLFDVGGVIRYVRAATPDQAPVQFDHGTWTAGGGFVSAGPTSGAVVGGPGGTATIDVPSQTGAVAGALLANPFVLTYDGDGLIDRAPGGTALTGTEYGASYRVGPCGGPGGPGLGYSVASVSLTARKRIVGGGTVSVRGKVAPARAGVPVELTAKARRSVVRSLVTSSDGAFAASIRVSETTQLRALAGGIASQTQRVTVKSRVRIKLQRRRGRLVVRGTVRPKLPGRVLLLRTTSPLPVARTKARKGRFTFRFRRLRRGRYQAVFIPSKGRAERATSNKGAVR